MTCCLDEDPVAQGPLSHPLWSLVFNASFLEDLTNALTSMRTPISLCKVPTKKGVCSFPSFRDEAWTLGYKAQGRHRISLFLSGLLKMLCSKEWAKPFEPPPRWQSPKDTRRSRSSSATKPSSSKLDTSQTLSMAAGDPLILKLGPLSLTSWNTPALRAIQSSTDCISWLKKPLMG